MLASLLGTVLSGEASAAAKRIKTQLIVFSILGAIALLGVLFLTLAAYLFAAQRMGAVEAALWFGGGLVGTALLGLVIYKITAGLRAKREARRRKAELTSVAMATALAVLPALVSKRAGVGILAAPILASIGYQIYKENVRSPAKKADADPD